MEKKERCWGYRKQAWQQRPEYRCQRYRRHSGLHSHIYSDGKFEWDNDGNEFLNGVQNGEKMQTRLTHKQKEYSLGSYNEYNHKEQWIRITEGCPHNCPYCREPQEQKVFGIPEIIRNDVKIMDMNLLCKVEAFALLKQLEQKRVNGKVVYYEFICGIDYRFLTQELADSLKETRIRKIRLAWDWFYTDQLKIKDAIKFLLKAGYKPKQIMIFMICNWKISFEECCNKLDLCKIWGVQVSDCYFDNQTFPKVIPIHWTTEQNKTFRKKCRKHNQLVNFGIDPELRNLRR